MLYVISTPIGNLKDITYRALEVMSNCFYILCEDTRISKILLNHYNIKIPLKSFYKFNEIKKQNQIIKDLKENKTIGLISDAGTPLLSDPGYNLLKTCFEENIKVEALPGACSIVQALVLSGFNTTPFQFVGFLPKNSGDLNYYIKKMLFYKGTSIAFEVANRITTTVEKITLLDPERNIAILKEMTKKFEMRISMKAKKLFNHLINHPVKGELVLVLDKGNFPEKISIEECVLLLQNMHGLSLKEAIDKCSKIKKISKKPIYKIFKIK